MGPDRTAQRRAEWPTGALSGDAVRLKTGGMATQNSIHVSDELLAELQAKAGAEGKTVDELAEEALRKGLEDRAWQDLLAYGLQTGRESGYTEADVPEIVKNRRRTNALQGR